MSNPLYKKHPFLAGTFILTMTGLISRVLGFFYRIYLSQLFGPEGIGIYQLLGPIMALSYSFTVAGIQTSISKYTASETSTGSKQQSLKFLLSGLILSISLSILTTLFLYKYSNQIAASFLLEKRTASMIRILSLTLPLNAIHSCINGYYYGIKKASTPASLQLIEQLFRIGSVIAITYIGVKVKKACTINVAVLGLLIGEFAASILSIVIALHRFKSTSLRVVLFKTPSMYQTSRKILSIATPLSLNRIIINFLQSIEAVYIPNRLIAYGYDHSTAISIYGVLTGMALPLILFPCALTNSISVLLLPIISEADETKNKSLIKKAIRKSIQYCILFGVLALILFFIFGRFAGQILFNNKLAGHFIITLSFICPFLYLSSTLASIINGLGKSFLVFFTNLSSLIIRLFFIFFGIPKVGIKGYLWALLFSQFYISTIYILYLKQKFNIEIQKKTYYN